MIDIINMQFMRSKENKFTSMFKGTQIAFLTFYQPLYQIYYKHIKQNTILKSKKKSYYKLDPYPAQKTKRENNDQVNLKTNKREFDIYTYLGKTSSESAASENSGEGDIGITLGIGHHV